MRRTDIINTLARKINAQTYLEIGLDSGENFRGVEIPIKISVDPAPRCNATYKVTSDEFFSKLADTEKFDIIFIDGLHLSSQVIKDVANSLNHLQSHGYIVMHDCNPPTEKHQDVDGYDITDPNHWPNGKSGKCFGNNREWNGDVWRAFLHFRVTRSDVSMFTIDTDWGVGVIKNGQQNLLNMNKDMSYSEFANKKLEILNLIPASQFVEFISKKTMAVCITHFGSGKFNNSDTNRSFFLDCMETYNSFKKYKLDIHLFLTEDVDCSKYINLSIVKHMFNKGIGAGLASQHIPVMKSLVNKYDLYLYAEDDTLINETNVDTFLEVQSSLPSPFITGFLTYEVKPNDPYKYYVCHHISCSVPRGGSTLIKDAYTINGQAYFEPYNLHQGSYLVTNDQFNFAIKNGYGSHEGLYQGPLENAATNLYWKCGFTKVFPRDKDKLDRMSIHHLPNRYVMNFTGMYNQNTLPNPDKLAACQMELIPKIIS